MKLIVPHTGELHAKDARLIRLAEFLGIHCEPLRLDEEIQQFANSIEAAVPDRNACLVINPQVIREWVGVDVLPADLLSRLVLHFPYLFMHALTPDAFVGNLVAAVSGGALLSVLPIADAGQSYEVSPDAKDICGPFAGLSFGPINTANDHVFGIRTDDSNVRKLICISGLPSMVAVWRDKTEILFLAGEDIVDVNGEIGSEPMSSYFSRLIPQAMALRHIFGEECWRSGKPQASIIIDDPLLRRDYGYLNFESLLRAAEQHNFQTTISFIPHNYKRNSARIIRMFRENPHRLSICFHGNDHTQAEFASNDTTLLNSRLSIAEARMKVHGEVTGLHCDKVMVFPQDDYSVEALRVLKSRNFRAAISRPYPVDKAVPLTIRALAQPAVLRYAGFPVFIRSFIKHTSREDIAFNIFFGKPILIGEHHDTFQRPASLLELVGEINSIAPGTSWCNLESVVDNSTLRRRSPDGTVQVRPYSSHVRIANDSCSTDRYSIEWCQSGQNSPIEDVLQDGTQSPRVTVEDDGIRISAELPAGASQTFSVVYRNDHTALGKPGVVWNAPGVFAEKALRSARQLRQ